jgi:hypothetical protein
VVRKSNPLVKELFIGNVSGRIACSTLIMEENIKEICI